MKPLEGFVNYNHARVIDFIIVRLRRKGDIFYNHVIFLVPADIRDSSHSSLELS